MQNKWEHFHQLKEQDRIKKILQMSFQLYTKSALEVRWLIYMKYIFKHFSSEHSGVTRILFLAPSLSSCWSVRIYPEAPLLLHSSDNDGNTINPIKTDDIVRDLLLDHGFFPLLLHQQTGMAKFHPTQPFTQRLFHQSGKGIKRQRTFLGGSPRLPGGLSERGLQQKEGKEQRYGI